MRIKIINPNTTWSMTEKIGACARAVASAGTEIVAVSPAMAVSYTHLTLPTIYSV